MTSNSRKHSRRPLITSVSSDDSCGRLGASLNHPETSPLLRSPMAARSWRKVLYEKQPFEDNYVDPDQFMRDLRRNANVRTYKYGQVVVGTFVLLQQISFVVFFLFAFAMILTERINDYALPLINGLLLTFTFLFYVNLQRRNAIFYGTVPTPLLHHVVELGRLVLPLLVLFVLLSPVLQTLTVTFSNDTIVSLSTCAMCIHLLRTDYNYLNGYSEKYQQNTAINAATVGTILMASRIHSLVHSGSLITFGTLCFSLSPIPRHHLKCASLTAHVSLTFILCGLSTICLMQCPFLAILYVLLLVVVSLIIPLCFVTLHTSAKSQINGPWDEAKPTNSAAAAEWANAGLMQ